METKHTEKINQILEILNGLSVEEIFWITLEVDSKVREKSKLILDSASVTLL